MTVNQKNSIILDTSFFIALAKAKDSNHTKAKKLAKAHSKKEWITTWPVLTELSHILSAASFVKLLEEQTQGFFSIFSFPEDTILRVVDLKKRYIDHDLDLADISLVLLAENLRHGSILTFDLNDFSFLKWGNTQRFAINGQM